jgi:hypothetical protein
MKRQRTYLQQEAAAREKFLRESHECRAIPGAGEVE